MLVGNFMNSARGLILAPFSAAVHRNYAESASRDALLIIHHRLWLDQSLRGLVNCGRVASERESNGISKRLLENPLDIAIGAKVAYFSVLICPKLHRGGVQIHKSFFAIIDLVE